MPLTRDDIAVAGTAATVGYQTEIDCWNPENWLTYRGDHRESVGKLMGPRYQSREHCTVVAAIHEQEANRTRLGLATGDVRGEMGERAPYSRTEAGETVNVVLAVMRQAS